MNEISGKIIEDFKKLALDQKILVESKINDLMYNRVNQNIYHVKKYGNGWMLRKQGLSEKFFGSIDKVPQKKKLALDLFNSDEHRYIIKGKKVVDEYQKKIRKIDESTDNSSIHCDKKNTVYFAVLIYQANNYYYYVGKAGKYLIEFNLKDRKYTAGKIENADKSTFERWEQHKSGKRTKIDKYLRLCECCFVFTIDSLNERVRILNKYIAKKENTDNDMFKKTKLAEEKEWIMCPVIKYKSKIEKLWKNKIKENLGKENCLNCN